MSAAASCASGWLKIVERPNQVHGYNRFIVETSSQNKLAAGSPKIHLALLTLAFAGYWALFVLFPQPSDLFDVGAVRVADIPYSLTILAVVALLSGLLAAGGREVADVLVTPATFIAAFAAFVAVVAVCLVAKLTTAQLPSAVLYVYGATLAVYGLILTLQLCRWSQDLAPGPMAVVLALSLLVSIAFGGLVTLLEIAGIDTSSSYPMLVLSGLFVCAGLLVQCRAASDGSAPSVKPQAGGNATCAEKAAAGPFASSAWKQARGDDGWEPSREEGNRGGAAVRAAGPGPAFDVSALSASPLVAFVLVCFLVGSGVFMNVSTISNEAGWFSNGWLHYAIGLLLYAATFIYALWAARRGREPYPWIEFFLLCIGVLYCASLLYGEAWAFCQEVVLPSRPLAIMLLWASVASWSRSRGKPYWAIAAIAPLAIFAVDFAAGTLGSVGLPSDRLVLVMNAITLVTAFAMTVGIALLVVRALRKGEDAGGHAGQGETVEGSVAFAEVADAAAVTDTPSASDGSWERARVALLRREYGLSERETEVLALLYRGNTQKKIAEELVVSLNSVQTYAKTLYRKLGVHSRQELIDLVNRGSA